jgi:hypothetical protein
MVSSSPHFSRSVFTIVLVGTALAVCLASCTHSPTAPPLLNPPRPPGTPLALVNYFQWCWTHRDPDRYREVISSDFRFEFATGDSAGVLWESSPWTRPDELLSSVHLFRDGTSTRPAASAITLQQTQAPFDGQDPTPGANPKWHRLLTLQILLNVVFTDSRWEVRGPVYLSVVRGDSAQIPVDLVAEGVKPDSTRWWVTRWVDGTLQSVPALRPHSGYGPAHTLPRRNQTWGDLKALYR